MRRCLIRKFGRKSAICFSRSASLRVESRIWRNVRSETGRARRKLSCGSVASVESSGSCDSRACRALKPSIARWRKSGTGGDGSSSSKNSTVPRRKGRSSFKRTISKRRRPRVTISIRPSGYWRTTLIHRRSAAGVDDPLVVGEHHSEFLALPNHLRRSFPYSGPRKCAGAARRRAAERPGAETAAIVPAACYYYHFRAACRAARQMILKLKRTPGIYLTGFMGCGKTTVGRALADSLGWMFADLDQEIEARAQNHHRRNFRHARRSGVSGTGDRRAQRPHPDRAVRAAAGDRARRRSFLERGKFRAGLEQRRQRLAGCLLHAHRSADCGTGPPAAGSRPGAAPQPVRDAPRHLRALGLPDRNCR